MKKRTSQSAFFNLRFFIGLIITLSGIIPALLGVGTSTVSAASTKQAQQTYTATGSIVPPRFDCAKIHEFGIGKQLNLRTGAIMIFCGEGQKGSAAPNSAASQLMQTLQLAPLNYGGTDVDL